MRFRIKMLACAAAGAMMMSAGASAAINANDLHMALTSLKLALVKIGVANAILSNPKPPANNTEAHVAKPEQLGSREISAILVSSGGVINVYLAPVVGVTNGIVQLVPHVVVVQNNQKTVRYRCVSPNITDIATAVPGCTYHPEQ